MRRFESKALATESNATTGEEIDSAGLTDALMPFSQPVGGGIAEDVLGPGAVLGDVTITRLIADGGMGRVYEGIQGRPSRTVAMKVVRPGLLSPMAMRRFEHEAAILGRLTHPGIARIYSAGVQSVRGCDLPYFVMEYVDQGRAITAYATERGLSTRRRVELFRGVCLAVAHGHQRGVIHRDLKPSNILVDAAGQVKVIDFGVARSTDGDVAVTTMLTDVGQLVGTAQYMSPEQFDGSVGDLDVRVDVYSLGVVLYELLVGRMPYDLSKRPVYEAARVVREVEPPSVSSIDRRLGGDLATIVSKCLEKDRGLRYSSAAELEADLGRHLRGEPITASPPRLLASVVRLARRHTAAATAAAGILMAIVAGGTAASIFAVQAARDREVAVREKARADAEARTARQRLYVANLRSLRSCLDTRNLRLARRLHDENLPLAGSPPPLEMKLLGAGLDEALELLTTDRAPVLDVAYRPDGRILAATTLRPSADGPSRRGLTENPSRFPATVGLRGDPLYFAVGKEHAHQRIPMLDDAWGSFWRSRIDPAAAVGGLVGSETTPVALASDGRHLAVHDPDGRLRVVKLPTAGGDRVVAGQAEEERWIEGHRGRVKLAAFSPDGSRLAIQLANGSVGLWDAGSGRLVVRCGDAINAIETFLFSPDGSRFLVLAHVRGRSHEARIHDAVDGRHLSTVKSPRGPRPFRPLVAFSSDGSRLVMNQDDGEPQVFRTVDGVRLGSLRGHAAVVTALGFSADGGQIASGDSHGTVRLWDAKSCTPVGDRLGHESAVTAVAFRPDAETFASSSQDGTIRIWSRAAGPPLAVLPGRRGLTAAAFSPDGRQVAIAPRGGCEVDVWDARTIVRRWTLVGRGESVAEIAYSPDGRVVAAAMRDSQGGGDVRVWSTSTGDLISVLGDRPEGAERVSFNADGSRIVATAVDGTATVWDHLAGRRIATAVCDYQGSVVDVGAVFGLDGRLLASRRALVMNTETGDWLSKQTLVGHVTCLAVPQDGRSFAAGMLSGAVYVFEFETRKRIARLAEHAGAVRAIAFRSDGSRLATGSADGSARVWDARTGGEICRLGGHEGSVEAVMFDRDGRRVVTSSTDGTIRIWDAESGEDLCVLPAQRDFPRAVALSPDGNRLVAAHPDGAIRILGLSNADIVAARQAAAAEQAVTEQAVTVSR